MGWEDNKLGTQPNAFSIRKKKIQIFVLPFTVYVWFGGMVGQS